MIKHGVKKNFYIPHPDADRSLFLTKLTGSASLEELRVVLQNNIGSFVPLTRKGQVRTMNTELFDLSAWLMENRNTITTNWVNNAVSYTHLTLPTILLV